MKAMPLGHIVFAIIVSTTASHYVRKAIGLDRSQHDFKTEAIRIGVYAGIFFAYYFIYLWWAKKHPKPDKPENEKV